MGKPDFILIGETKCGTTSMYNYLSEHPKVLPSLGNGEGYDPSYAAKELRFFDKFYKRGWDWYFSCFPETSSDEITGEATPMYMYRSQAADRIKQGLPDVKLIVMLRNPVHRLISNYEHNYKWVPGYKERYPDLKAFWQGNTDPDYYLIEKGIYYYSLLKWFRYFSREQVLVLKSETMYENPEEAYLEVTRFLGLEDHKLEGYPVYRANQYDDIDSNLKKEIHEFYAPYNAMLEQLLETKFDWTND